MPFLAMDVFRVTKASGHTGEWGTVPAVPQLSHMPELSETAELSDGKRD